MYIEDEELREVYKIVTPERLQKLEDTLIYLERQSDDAAQLEEFLREAHTLKGDSRMLGVDDVETITHQIEDCLAPVKQGEEPLTSALCDRLYQALDAIRKLVHEAVTGEEADVNVFYVIATLMGADSNNPVDEGSSSREEETLFADEEWLFPEPAVPATATRNESAQAEAAPLVQPAAAAATVSVSTQEIDTIRVAAEKLDILMTQAGELNVAKLRIARRMEDLAALLKLYEEWSRDAAANRLALKQVEQGVHNGHLEKVRRFQHLAEQRLESLGTLVYQLKNAASEDTARLESVSHELESGIKILRLLPLSTIFNLFPRMARDLAKQQGKEVNLVIEGGETTADKRILEEIKDPLLHILRNAIDHGIETPQERESQGKPSTATIRLSGYKTGSRIGIEVVDDGRGLDLERIKQTALERNVCSEEELAMMTTEQIQTLIFSPGFSTRTEVSAISGRGIGLDVVRTNVERLKGSIQVESLPGKGCQFRLQLSTSLATTYVLIVEVNQETYAIPAEVVEKMLLVSRSDIFSLEGNETISFEGQPVSVKWLADLLELPITAPAALKPKDASVEKHPAIILKLGSDRLAILVDALLEQQDIVLKPQCKLLQRIRNVSGATILGNGEVCMVLNPQDLLKSAQKGSRAVISQQDQPTQATPKVLLVEDSIIIRTQMKRLLEGAGYDLTIAVDGVDGFNKLRSGHFDAVVSDVEMPNMDGLTLTGKIRQYREYSELPIILVTTLASDDDKRRGAQVGANAYLTKGDFDQKVLIETLKNLV